MDKWIIRILQFIATVVILFLINILLQVLVVAYRYPDAFFITGSMDCVVIGVTCIAIVMLVICLVLLMCLKD
jgi:hypothetical protein